MFFFFCLVLIWTKCCIRCLKYQFYRVWRFYLYYDLSEIFDIFTRIVDQISDASIFQDEIHPFCIIRNTKKFQLLQITKRNRNVVWERQLIGLQEKLVYIWEMNGFHGESVSSKSTLHSQSISSSVKFSLKNLRKSALHLNFSSLSDYKSRWMICGFNFIISRIFLSTTLSFFPGSILNSINFNCWKLMFGHSAFWKTSCSKITRYVGIWKIFVQIDFCYFEKFAQCSHPTNLFEWIFNFAHYITLIQFNVFEQYLATDFSISRMLFLFFEYFKRIW